jgi:hypothetical protein
MYSGTLSHLQDTIRIEWTEHTDGDTLLYWGERGGDGWRLFERELSEVRWYPVSDPAVVERFHKEIMRRRYPNEAA